jgi:hypothetical protein
MNMEIITFIGLFILGILFLGKVLVSEKRRKTQVKKLIKNLENFQDKKGTSVKMPGKNSPRGWHN